MSVDFKARVYKEDYDWFIVLLRHRDEVLADLYPINKSVPVATGTPQISL